VGAARGARVVGKGVDFAGDADGLYVCPVNVGVVVGWRTGARVGARDGLREGAAEGARDGRSVVGDWLGCDVDGVRVGRAEVGESEGKYVWPLNVGVVVGWGTGARVGRAVGDVLGTAEGKEVG